MKESPVDFMQDVMDDFANTHDELQKIKSSLVFGYTLGELDAMTKDYELLTMQVRVLENKNGKLEARHNALVEAVKEIRELTKHEGVPEGEFWTEEAWNKERNHLTFVIAIKALAAAQETD